MELDNTNYVMQNSSLKVRQSYITSEKPRYFPAKFFHINVSYLYQMTKFYYFGSVALRVKVLQIESECFRFKPHQVLSCYLAVPQPTLSHYQQDIPTTSMLITELSKILTWGHQEACNNPTLPLGSRWDQVKAVSMQRLISS